MTRIESETKLIDKPIEELFNFLSDFTNYEKLMPERIKDWKATRDNCTFEIKGTAPMGMQIAERKSPEQIKIRDYGKVPFPFDLLVLLKKVSDQQTQVRMMFDADMNPMIEMLAKSPLQNFLNILIDKMKDIDLK